MTSTKLPLLLLCVSLAVAAIACSPTEQIDHEDNPTGLMAHALLSSIATNETSGSSLDLLKTLGVDRDSETGDALVRLSQKIELEFPLTPSLPTEMERRERLNQRMHMTGRELGLWLMKIETDGGDPETTLNRMLYDSSWRMSTASIDTSLRGLLGLERDESESLGEMNADLDSHFRRGLKAAMGEVPAYVTQGPK